MCSSKLTHGDNFKRIHRTPIGCDTNSPSIRTTYEDISNKSVTSSKQLFNTTADSDKSVFMDKPLCCAGIVGSRVITKDRKKSIKLRFKKVAKQLKGLHQPELKNTEIKTLAVL